RSQVTSGASASVPPVPDRLRDVGAVECRDARERGAESRDRRREPDDDRLAADEPSHRDHPTADDHSERHDLHHVLLQKLSSAPAFSPAGAVCFCSVLARPSFAVSLMVRSPTNATTISAIPTTATVQPSANIPAGPSVKPTRNVNRYHP